MTETQDGPRPVPEGDEVPQTFGGDEQRVELAEVELLARDRRRSAEHPAERPLERHSIKHHEILQRPELGVGLFVIDVVREHGVAVLRAPHDLQDDPFGAAAQVDPRIVERDPLHAAWYTPAAMAAVRSHE